MATYPTNEQALTLLEHVGRAEAHLVRQAHHVHEALLRRHRDSHGGPLPYGLEVGWSEAGKVVRPSLRESEVLATAWAWWQSGTTWRQAAEWATERGWTRRQGDPWTPASLASAVKSLGLRQSRQDPPYGYQLVLGWMVPHLAEQAALRRILAGRCQGESWEAIAQGLRASGLTDRRERQIGWRWVRQRLSGLVHLARDGYEALVEAERQGNKPTYASLAGWAQVALLLEDGHHVVRQPVAPDAELGHQVTEGAGALLPAAEADPAQGLGLLGAEAR